LLRSAQQCDLNKSRKKNDFGFFFSQLYILLEMLFLAWTFSEFVSWRFLTPLPEKRPKTRGEDEVLAFFFLRGGAGVRRFRSRGGRKNEEGNRGNHQFSYRQAGPTLAGPGCFWVGMSWGGQSGVCVWVRGWWLSAPKAPKGPLKKKEGKVGRFQWDCVFLGCFVKTCCTSF
jgi:hypothetical protein